MGQDQVSRGVSVPLLASHTIFKTPKQSYSVSKMFSSKHRAVIFCHSSVATTYKVSKYNVFTKPAMVLYCLYHRIHVSSIIRYIQFGLFITFVLSGQQRSQAEKLDKILQYLSDKSIQERQGLYPSSFFVKDRCLCLKAKIYICIFPVLFRHGLFCLNNE